MKTFKELLDGKPSNAVQAMIDGLRDADNIESFKVDMETYGNAKNGTCFGCAATATIMKITGVEFTEESILSETKRSFACDMGKDDLNDFEIAIDWLRESTVLPLLKYMNTPNANLLVKKINTMELPCLMTNSYRQHLPKYEKLVEYLKSVNL